MNADDPYASPHGNTQFGDLYDAQYPAGQGYELKHSGIGIISFVIAMVAGTTLFAIIVALALEAQGGGEIDETDPKMLLMGLGILAAIGFSFCGLILGIISVCLRDRKKIFGILGLTFNGTIVLGIAAMVAMALIVGAAA
ncbi:MAG: hypothetical protein WBF93_07510 [Pirellulales bacterium]|nr:hypothetical protein [Pirellulales bacterium]